jgi:hypothetical protein
MRTSQRLVLLIVLALTNPLYSTRILNVNAAYSAPIVKLDDGEFVGFINNTVAQFFGIPYGQST